MILIVNNHDHNAGKIGARLKALGQSHIIKDADSLLQGKDLKGIKGIILTGGPLMLDKPLKLSSIRADIASILDFKVPVLGICLGYEIMAEILGSEVERLHIPSKSPKQKVRILKKEYLFEGFPDTIEVFESHSLYMKNLPPFLEITASSSKDTIESIRHKQKPLFGVQFHPEESGEISEKLFSNFIEICNGK